MKQSLVTMGFKLSVLTSVYLKIHLGGESAWIS